MGKLAERWACRNNNSNKSWVLGLGFFFWLWNFRRYLDFFSLLLLLLARQPCRKVRVNLPKGERVATTTVTNLGFWVWDFFLDFGILDGTWIFSSLLLLLLARQPCRKVRVNLPKGECVATTTVINLGFWVWDFIFGLWILDLASSIGDFQLDIPDEFRTPSLANKTLANFYGTHVWSLFHIFWKQNVYEPNFANFLGHFHFDILLNVIDDFHFCCFISFVGGYLIKRMLTDYILEICTYHIYFFD